MTEPKIGDVIVNRETKQRGAIKLSSPINCERVKEKLFFVEVEKDKCVWMKASEIEVI